MYFDAELFYKIITTFKTYNYRYRLKFTSMYSFVNVKRRLLCESFETHITLKWPFAGMCSHMDVKIRFSRKRSWALFTLEWPFLNCSAFNTTQNNNTILIFHLVNLYADMCLNERKEYTL